MYTLSIKDPVLTEMPISGTIKIILKNFSIHAIGELTNLPQPWTNPDTGRLLYINKIGPIETTSLNGTEEDIINDMISLLEDELNNSFGIYIKGRLVINKEDEGIKDEEFDFNGKNVLEVNGKYIVMGRGKSKQNKSNATNTASLNAKGNLSTYLGDKIIIKPGTITENKFTTEGEYIISNIIIKYENSDVVENDENSEPIIPKTKQVIFDIKKNNYLINDEFGELKITKPPNKDIDFIFED